MKIGTPNKKNQILEGMVHKRFIVTFFVCQEIDRYFFYFFTSFSYFKIMQSKMKQLWRPLSHFLNLLNINASKNNFTSLKLYKNNLYNPNTKKNANKIAKAKIYLKHKMIRIMVIAVRIPTIMSVFEQFNVLILFVNPENFVFLIICITPLYKRYNGPICNNKRGNIKSGIKIKPMKLLKEKFSVPKIVPNENKQQ